MSIPKFTMAITTGAAGGLQRAECVRVHAAPIVARRGEKLNALVARLREFERALRMNEPGERQDLGALEVATVEEEPEEVSDETEAMAMAMAA